MALAACGGGSSDVEDITAPVDDTGEEHDDGHGHIETAGRLVVLEQDSAQVHVVELDDGSVLTSFAADNAPSAIYASPEGRYALLFQRTQNQVQFIDGGIWLEQHGDHTHDYQEAPALLNLRLSGVRPTHYSAHDGLGAVFFDGDASSAANASFTLLSDASIGSGQAALASQALRTPMHGAAEPRGDWVISSWRAADGNAPTQVELYHLHGDHFHDEGVLDVACPGLHGSHSNSSYTVFGCEDGVLVVHQAGESLTASKIGHGQRISTIIGNEHLATFVGLGSGGAVFEIDPAAASITAINWAEGRTHRAHALDAEGENLLLLDEQGDLHILATADWSKRAEIDAAIADMPAAAPYPAFAASGAQDKVWLSDPQGQKLHLIHMADAELEGSIPLNFKPTGVVWLGMAAHEHEDEHEH
ncbi:hypothetical protein D8I35_17510 [Corticibacter populi]|uniref:Uncharacterized protein n=1 Tax=Corticibacter populi TaxID=1550736 RepID=A0A3M6QIQ9_9BURK|nr:hypothetical protein [Corticibacter populi]RMX02976.1 hypothetical protein D8I35_17510 [Corticibacter populi]